MKGQIKTVRQPEFLGSRGFRAFAAVLMGVLLLCAGRGFEYPSPAREVVTPHQARPTSAFLDTIGVVSTFPDRGQPIDKTVGMIRFCGFRWIRAGIEGLSENGPTTLQTFIDLHHQTGAKLSWGLVSGHTDIGLLVSTARELAKAGALLAIEGNNEPNNWGVEYEGERGGGNAPSWMAVARVQRDLYRAVKTDPVLARYPVWSISEPGAESDNVGLQFLTIPAGARTLMPDGTRFADFANVHNYVYHPHSPLPGDNKAWNAADPGKSSPVDGLYGNYGRTWRRGFSGYDETALASLPRVTTETGVRLEGPVDEEQQGRTLLNLYLDQFARGYAYTSVYILRDRTDEGGNQAFGFFRPDYTPRRAAIYLHNLTAVLADGASTSRPGKLDYAIPVRPATVHDVLLQRSDRMFQLVVWGERLNGKDDVTIALGKIAKTIELYDPTIGTAPIRTLHAVRSFKLELTDHPIVIMVR
ncbi:MAG: hypothetical protein KGM93_18395 [Sphingomonadales bacterium]|nr:hypothetical protein [Sphingomonadales bacterium]